MIGMVATTRVSTVYVLDLREPARRRRHRVRCVHRANGLRRADRSCLHRTRFETLDAALEPPRPAFRGPLANQRPRLVMTFAGDPWLLMAGFASAKCAGTRSIENFRSVTSCG